MRARAASFVTSLVVAIALRAHAQSATTTDDVLFPPPPVHSKLALNVPAVHEARLANGIRVLLAERHDLPNVAVTVTSDLGAVDAAPGLANLAAETAEDATFHSHWFHEGHRFNRVGADIRTGAGYEQTDVSTEVLSPYVEDALVDLAEVATQEFLAGSVVAAKRERLVAEAGGPNQTSPTTWTRSAIFPKGYAYRNIVLGAGKTIAGFGGSDLRAFWSRAFSAKHVVIGASGDITIDRLLRALAPFERLPRGDGERAKAPAPFTVPPRTGVIVVDRPNATQADVEVLAVGRSYFDPNWAAYALMANALELFLHSRIREEHGSTYGVEVDLETTRGPGLLTIRTKVETSQCVPSLEQIFVAMMDLRQGKLEPERFARVRTTTVQSVADTFETNRGTAGMIASLAVEGTSLDSIHKLADAVAAVTPDQVAKMAATHLDPPGLRIVIYGDAKAIVPTLQKIKPGKIEVH